MPHAHYPVSFSAGWQAPATGVLAVEETRVLLDGRSPQGHVELSIPYAEIGEVRIGRLPEEWLKGHAALLVSQTGGEVIRVQPIGFGLLSELADLLSTLARDHADEHEQVAVTLPLRRGCLSQAAALVAKGPPFDPELLGLKRHEVYLTEEEAVFVFEGPNVRKNFERLSRDPTLWQAGLEWRRCAGGRPRLSSGLHRPSAPPAFSWAAPSG